MITDPTTGAEARIRTIEIWCVDEDVPQVRVVLAYYDKGADPVATDPRAREELRPGPRRCGPAPGREVRRAGRGGRRGAGLARPRPGDLQVHLEQLREARAKLEAAAALHAEVVKSIAAASDAHEEVVAQTGGGQGGGARARARRAGGGQGGKRPRADAA